MPASPRAEARRCSAPAEHGLPRQADSDRAPGERRAQALARWFFGRDRVDAPGLHAARAERRFSGRERNRIAGLLVAVLSTATLAWLAGAQSPPARADDPAAVAAHSVATSNAAVVIVLRHAEKDPAGDPTDPGLSEAGRARARSLAQMLAPSGATHFYASEFRRTRETLTVLAEQAGGTLTVVPARETARLIETLRGLASGSVAIVAAHSNTLPAIVRGLGGEVAHLVETPHGPALDESEFGRIFVVTRIARADGTGVDAATLELAYPD